MSQVTNFKVPTSPLTMSALAVALESVFAALGSINRGAAAPSNPFEGMLWWDSAAVVEILKRYTATAGWVSIFSVNRTTGVLALVGTTGSAAANGDFTSGTVYWSKIGNSVEVSWSVLGHGSDAEPDSLAALIPAAYRPAAAVHNVCSFNALVLSQIIIKTDGQFSVSYCDWTGTPTVRTGANAGSVSYIV